LPAVFLKAEGNFLDIYYQNAQAKEKNLNSKMILRFVEFPLGRTITVGFNVGLIEFNLILGWKKVFNILENNLWKKFTHESFFKKLLKINHAWYF
jgi:hypothetical protein